MVLHSKKMVWCQKTCLLLELFEYLGIRDALPLIVVCRSCGKRTSRGEVKYFITFNVRNQLIGLLNERGHGKGYSMRKL